MIFVPRPVTVFLYFKTKVKLYSGTIGKEDLTIGNSRYMLAFNQRVLY